MSELYVKNLKAIDTRWPEVAKHINAQQTDTLDAFLVEAKSQTISVNGIQLSSRYDALEEAFFYRSQTEGEVYHLFGCAMGDIPKLLAHDKAAKEIHIYLINPDVFKLVLHFTDQPWLEDERFHLHQIPENQFLLEYPLAHPGSIILASEKELCKRHDASLYYRIDNFIYGQHLNRNLLNEEQQEFDSQRLKENLPYIRKHKPADRLVDKHLNRHKSVIVIGAGPTLEDSIDKLKVLAGQKKRPFIIAVTMAGKLLLKHGIIPDVLVHIDRGPNKGGSGRDLSDFIPYELASKGTALVYATLIQKEIIQKWNGDAYYTNLYTQDYDESAKVLPTERMFIHGSVIAPAVHMAASFARQRVYFTGMDFSFPDKKFHAGMSNDTHQGSIILDEVVKNGFGEEIETSRSYRTFLSGVENLVFSFPKLSFINCSRRGAKIKGTEYLDNGEIK